MEKQSDKKQGRRIGRFCVSHYLVEQHWEKLLPLMSKVFVVRAESLYARDCIEYVALSPEFAEASFDVVTPEYEVRCFQDEGDGPFRFEFVPMVTPAQCLAETSLERVLGTRHMKGAVEQ